MVIILCIYSTNVCHGHGWLKDPPSRSSMWKYGFPTPPNYNHMQLFCGGFYVQTVLNHGKCGTCGDRWDGTRENEAGGPYATGRISRRYQEGQTMTAEIMITAQHFGYFEFRVCPNNNTSKKASEECFEKYPLHQPDGSERYYLNGQSEMYNVKLVLPMGLTCSQCVFQWTWYAGMLQ
ncbi:hypothetical protein KUTeg_009714 [Tegillarca granosa]|uniref:Chitin-binding type-4 domain-containing protein n=1 Tax=Tegillarca granosa TaxID=220873 RepID=A0ABQ9F803_TEGGR|nr:hypothetical protein KUTeg_009714 [Tegillarca granosa]